MPPPRAGKSQFIRAGFLELKSPAAVRAVPEGGGTRRRALVQAVIRRGVARRDVDLQDRLHGFGKVQEMFLDRRRQRVEPMDPAQKILHGLCGRDLLDAHRHDRNGFGDSPLDLPMNLDRIIRTRGKNEDHHATSVHRLDDGGAVLQAGPDIARGNPAPDAGAFQHRAGSVCRRLVLARVTDERVKSHLRAQCASRRSAIGPAGRPGRILVDGRT